MKKTIDITKNCCIYTNENETVLDFTAGSFTTGVACQNTNRQFIGIELDEAYFEIGKKRLGIL